MDNDLRQISIDIPRTFPEEPFFNSPESEGRNNLKQLLWNLSKHSSSAGYTQGMNYIVASLYFHSNEIFAFELTIRALNDYHVKEVHMRNLPGLYHHCEILEAIIKQELPALANHFKQLNVKVQVFAQNWVLCLFTQCIPLSQVQRFYSMFWRLGWAAHYRVVLALLQDLQPGLFTDNSDLHVQMRIKNSFALKASQCMLSPADQEGNKNYWEKIFDLLETE